MRRNKACPLATAKADSRKRSCPLYPQKRTCAVQTVMSDLGQKRTHAPQHSISILTPHRPAQADLAGVQADGDRAIGGGEHLVSPVRVSERYGMQSVNLQCERPDDRRPKNDIGSKRLSEFLRC
jgi:hypothetical protein